MKASFFNKNTGFLRQKIKEYLERSQQWFLKTPERALSEAYQAAQIIKNIEIEQFGGKTISPESANYSESVMAYWEVSLQKNLTILKVKLAEFRFSYSLLNISNPVFLEKLKFIDEVSSKYITQNITQEKNSDDQIIPVSQPLQINGNEVNNQSDYSRVNNMKVNPVFQKTGAFPRSIGRTLNKIKGDLSPQAEENFVRNFQISRKRTRTAIRFLVMLVIVPLLTQHFSKQFLINPIVERIRGENFTQLFLNNEMEEEALSELKTFEKKLKFESLVRQAPPISAEVIEEKVKHKVREIAEEFQEKSNEAISNVFADVMSLIAFALVIVTSKREIAIVKSFIDDVIYGLSDSAKAFIIILFTDIFVGFHSPHGWEVILEGFAEHLGLPANQSVISLFIATFPVILDTISKYWIFRYLSRLSPSALATLKEMND
ncbi:CemA family protein [Scytonema sp. HK-05]|uniref:proton extrusion protein PcxA n=1 Tax=Scytonema sp. HK-05 TaxID=1137095 RepID=UPI0009376288|nr:proton extrusion protein PcxA [Scytonema sp. HK-05]OKH57567.1 proton extrusion protein PcxA [Scytonema sp. HK-05]BAY46718.1 CemA family protein [Scytonema sp. HK-05]